MAQLSSAPPELPVLLRSASRSFYLSIRLLPQALRRPIGVAYLLARTSDTLADSTELPVESRRDLLEIWSSAVEGRLAGSAASARIAGGVTELRAEGARELIDALPHCLAWLDELPVADRDDIRAVLRHISYGQSLDIERFEAHAPPRVLETAEQLDEYTYLVAGCVGEFWTDLCLRHVPDFARLPPHEMRELGRGYGMGLQLVNILRDVGEDLAAGRCYFPAEELHAAGLRPQDIGTQPERFETVWKRWHAQAVRGLDLGMRYADAVESRRLRAASVLPALLGARTLGLLRRAGAQRLQQRVKVPRRQVRAILARMALTLAGRSTLASLYRQLRGNDPGGGWDNPRP